MHYGEVLHSEKDGGTDGTNSSDVVRECRADMPDESPSPPPHHCRGDGSGP